MPWRPMPPNTRLSVATAQSWPNAPAADGRTQGDSRIALSPGGSRLAPGDTRWRLDGSTRSRGNLRIRSPRHFRAQIAAIHDDRVEITSLFRTTSRHNLIDPQLMLVRKGFRPPTRQLDTQLRPKTLAKRRRF